MRVTLIGGTRFIGPAIARRFLERGHHVTLVHRGVHPCALTDAAVLHADRSDAAALAHAIDESRAECVVDTRAMTEADALTASQAVGERPVVVLSSQDVYAQFGRLNALAAPAPQALVTEESPLTVPYPFRGRHAHDGGEDYDKKLVEQAYTLEGSRRDRSTTILRLPAVYGPGDPNRRFGVVVDALDAGQTQLPRKGGLFRWTHSHVRDVAHATVLATEFAQPGTHIYNVGEPQSPTMSQWAERLAAAAGVEFEWQETDTLSPSWALFGEMPNDMVVCSQAIRRALGFTELTTEDERMHDLLYALRASRTPPVEAGG